MDEIKVKKILLRLANMVAAEIGGSSVHPCEDFSAPEIYEMVIGDNLEPLIVAGIKKWFKNREEGMDIYGAKGFNININTLEIEEGYADFIKTISFWQIGTLLLYGDFDKSIKKPETQEMVTNYRTAFRKKD